MYTGALQAVSEVQSNGFLSGDNLWCGWLYISENGRIRLLQKACTANKSCLSLPFTVNLHQNSFAMKTLLTLTFVLIAVRIAFVLLSNGSFSVTSSMSRPTDSTSTVTVSTERIDSLLLANNLRFDEWNLYPSYSKTWVNGETKNESYLVAKFINLDSSAPLDQQQLSAFSQQVYASIAADLEPNDSYERLHIQFENREDNFLMNFTKKYYLTYLLREPEQTVAAN